MKYFLTIFSILIASANLFAQQDTVLIKSDSLPKGYISKVREKLKAGTEYLNVGHLLKTDTLKAPQKLDSVKQASEHKTDSLKKIVNVTQGLTHKEDSIQKIVEKPVDVVNKKIAGVENKIQHHTDLLTNALTQKIAVPKGIQHNADSLQNKVNSLDKKLTGAESTAQNKVNGLESKITKPVAAEESKIKSKISEVTDGQVKIPAQDKLNLPQTNLPGLKGVDTPLQGTSLPATSLPNVDGKLPSVNTGNLTQNLNIPKVDTNISKDIPNVKTGLSKIDLPKTDELNKVKDLSGEVSKLDGKLAEGEKYEGDLKKLKAGENPEKLAGEAESQLKNVGQVKAVSVELNKAKAMQAQQEALLQRYQDKKMLKEEFTRKAANVANDVIGQHTKELKSAQAELAKTKKLSSFKNVKKVKDIFRRTSDELDGKKFYQHLVPGMTLQIYNNKTVIVDWATQLGYRVSPRLTTGIGFTYRVGFSDKYQYFMSNQGVYGGRAYFDFVVLKGIYAHGEFEYLKLNPQRFAQIGSQELPKPQVYGSYFGLGKKFKISRKIKGSVLGLYRVEYNGTLPSMSRLNVRLGFDYVFRKYKKLTGPAK